MDGGDLVKPVLLLVALLVSIFFSASEAAFLSIQRGRLASMVRTRVRGADRAARIAGQPEKLLPTVLTGNNLANVAATALATSVAASYFSPNWAIVVSTGGVTLTLLVFAETLPKTIATRKAERTALLVARPLEIVQMLFFPAVWLLERLSQLVARLLGAGESKVTEDEIRSLIDVAETEGVMESSEAQMLEQVFYFGDRPVDEIMVPRTEITWVEKGINLEEFMEAYSPLSHSRFPVYEDNHENVVGILWVKDLLEQTARGQVGPKDSITQVLRPAYFVPESKLVAQLFDEMKSRKEPMAVVVDQHGGVAGLITTQRLLEIIAGRVSGEHEEASEPIIALSQYRYDVDGGLTIHEANQTLHLNLPDNMDYRTVAGFILKELGRIPQVGDSVQRDGVRLEVKEMLRVKIERVEVRLPDYPVGEHTSEEPAALHS